MNAQEMTWQRTLNGFFILLVSVAGVALVFWLLWTIPKEQVGTYVVPAPTQATLCVSSNHEQCLKP